MTKPLIGLVTAVLVVAVVLVLYLTGAEDEGRALALHRTHIQLFCAFG